MGWREGAAESILHCPRLSTRASLISSTHIYLRKWSSLQNGLVFLTFGSAVWACGILVPWTRLNPGSQQWGHGGLNHWLPGNSQVMLQKKKKKNTCTNKTAHWTYYNPLESHIILKIKKYKKILKNITEPGWLCPTCSKSKCWDAKVCSRKGFTKEKGRPRHEGSLGAGERRLGKDSGQVFPCRWNQATGLMFKNGGSRHHVRG